MVHDHQSKANFRTDRNVTNRERTWLNNITWWVALLSPFTMSAASFAGSMAAAVVIPRAQLPSDLLVAIPVYVMILVGVGAASIAQWLALFMARSWLPIVGAISALCCAASFGISFYLAAAILQI